MCSPSADCGWHAAGLQSRRTELGGCLGSILFIHSFISVRVQLALFSNRILIAPSCKLAVSHAPFLQSFKLKERKLAGSRHFPSD